jgi:hypothetical protein
LIGLTSISSYNVEYSTNAFQDEVQQVVIACPNVVPTVQTITTSVVGTPKFAEQFVVLTSTAASATIIPEVQQVVCLATGGVFGLTFAGQTAYINYNAQATDIQTALQALNSLTAVTVSFGLLTTQACQATNANGFSVTFTTVVGFAGNLPLMAYSSNGLSGVRSVAITRTTTGNARK